MNRSLFSDLFDEDKSTFMKGIEDLERPNRDKIRNVILEMEENGRQERHEELWANTIKG